MLGSKAIVTEHPYVTHCRRYLAEAQRDPLFSAPHLKDFLEYLSEPSSQWPVDDKPFTWPYPRPMINDLRRSSDTRSNSFDIPEKVTRDHESLGLLFLSGYPSSRWLKDVGEKYKVDMHFFQQHLGSIRPSVHVDVFAEPSLPSSSGHTLKLKIPTIGYLGDTGDSFRDMSRTRALLVEDLRKQILDNAQRHPVGQPIVRDVYLHNQEHFTLLQEVSMCLLRDKNMWTVLIWTDAGYEDKDPDLSFLFKRAPNMLHIAPKLCPTVFNRPIRFGESVYSSVASSDVRFNATQVFNSLHKAYGKTLDPHLTSQDPFYAVSEVYSFAAAAENQFLNMMRDILDNRIESIVRESLQSKNSTHDALPERANIQYDRTILDAHSDRISNVVAFLKAADDPVWFPNVDHHDRREASRARTSLVHDFQHLHAQIIQLIQRCERAMDMVAHNASLLEAKRSNLQSEGLEKLTRLTTIVTLLYVPLSFVCTFFGMNFSTCGQGKLSLWIWAAVSAPVMLISLVFLRRMLKNDSKKTRP